jgi:diguanylate cyclase (GGDEF)-like protein
MEKSSNLQCLQYLSDILHTMRTTKEYERVFSAIVTSAVRLFHCRTCAIVLIDPQTEYLTVACSTGLSWTFEKAFRRKLATGAVGKLLWTEREMYVKDSALEPELAEELKLEHPFASCACAQISVDVRTLGYIFVDSAEVGGIGEEDLHALHVFADLAGLAYMKAQLYVENLRLDRIDRETGLFKYITFLDELKLKMEEARDNNTMLAIFLCDVNNFKKIAQMYGYDCSRQLLKEIGAAARTLLGASSIAARYGFDEFIFLLPNTGEEAIAQAEALADTIAQKQFTKQNIQSSVSVGVALYPQNGTNMESLLMTVKKAMFEAQRLEHGHIFHYPGVWDATTEPAMT